MNYKKILLKLSGEALYDKNNGVISKAKLVHFVNEIKSITEMGIKVSIVMGGGNIIRGENIKNLEISRYKADNMGMLATVINSIALEDALINNNVNAVLLSAIEMNKICNFYSAQLANSYLDKNTVVICAGGIANPHFSTDTGAVLRGLELGVDVVLKGTQVDGVYDSDPKHNPNANMFEKISYDDVLNKQLKIMDNTAIILAKKEKLPIIVFNIHEAGNLKEIILKTKNHSIIASY